MTNREKLQETFPNMIFIGTVMMYKPTDQVLASGINYNWLNAEYEIPTSSTTKNNLEVDVISRTDALRVAKNEYLRGWHNALCKALSEEFSIHCEEGNFSVIQEETITGLGLSMDCALGKDVESYMSTMPSVTSQEPALDKIRAEVLEYIDDLDIAVEICDIFNKYKAEYEV